MKITLLTVGKTTEEYLKTGINNYMSRIKHYIKLEIKEIPELKNAKSLSESQIKTEEGSILLKHIKPGDFIILLDEKGKQTTSIDFSKFINSKINTGIKNIVFIVGGAYGFSDTIYNKADELLSMSKMTFSHQMIRLLFIEQLYRAFTILKNEPYHHE